MAGNLESPYLNRKGIDLDALKKSCGTRVFAKQGKIAIMDEADEVIDTHEGVFVFRELVDVTGKAMGFERILDEKVKRYPDKKAGDKYLTRGSSTSGFTPIGFTTSELPHLSGEILVCCGLADGFRIHEATGLPVACGVGENSLPKLAKLVGTAGNCFGERVSIIVAADNDKAGIAAAMRSGCRWVVPEAFKDWSDIYQGEGLVSVRENLSHVQDPVPADELQDRLAELGVIAGGNGSKPKEATNHWVQEQAAGSEELGPVAVHLAAPNAIEGIAQYMALLAHTGVVASPSERRIEARTLEAHGLVISMLSDGLMASLPPTEQEIAEAHSRKALTMASQGKLDDIEVVVRSPVLVMAGKDETGRAALRLSCAYDERLKDVFRSIGGYWNKGNREWVLPADTETRLDNALGHVLSAALGRAVVMREPSDGGPRFITGSPERANTFKEVLMPAIQPIWAAQPAEKLAEQDEDVAITFSVTEQNGWPAVSIRLPYQAREVRDELKGMGAKFSGTTKQWSLALRDEVLDKLQAWGAQADGPSVEEIRRALEVCGFGHLEAVDQDTFAVSSPYHAPLIERLKDGLPRLARRFDSESKAWQIDVSSAEVAQELRAIAEEFDLRLLDARGQPLPRMAGWDDVLAGKSLQQPARNVSAKGGTPHSQAPTYLGSRSQAAAGGPGI